MRLCIYYRLHIFCFATCVWAWAGAGSLVLAAEPPEVSEGELLFALRIKPLLAERCLACHGKDPDQLQGELDLTSRDGMLAGGESSDKILVPGRAADSLLYIATTWEDASYEMPPKENDRLTEQQTWTIRDWINAGAPWPDEPRIASIIKAHAGTVAEGVTLATSGGLSDDWTNRRYKPDDLWAYRALIRPEVPDGGSGKGDNPIDAFVNRRMQQFDLAPAPRADRRDLIRRATYDLTGLPAMPNQVETFVHDPAPDGEAFGRVVDRLLASPHYGERWGRHWLDVVRYADTSGFANDFERPNAWRYRDYVIRSFNEDKPYDQFVREQIAGDEIDPSDPEMLIATGFLRMGPWEHTAMSVGRVTRQQFLDDVTDSVGQVFLSHPLQCARCHDHKFDPIPIRDYYAIQAAFATTQFAERDAPFLATENTDGFARERGYLERRIRRYEALLSEIRQKEEQAARRWYADRGLQYAPRSQLIQRGVPEDKIAPRHVGLSATDFGMDRIARKNLTRHRWELDRFRPLALSVYSGKTAPFHAVNGRLKIPGNSDTGTLEETAILAGGDPFSPTTRVRPGVLTAIAGASADVRSSAFTRQPAQTASQTDDITGRRLAFAHWVATADNPLTVRSIVNRIWQYHFGQGIARNPNNFGAMGKKPTHPELLDWLATRFIEDGWSIRRMHRLIMASDAYCRSSRHPDMPTVLEKDPERISYACFRFRRLSAEELRDSMLSVSGELNLLMGGVPIRPDMNPEVALQPRQIMGTYAPAYQPSPLPSERNRRSIYALVIRGLRDPLMEVFNQPGPEKSCELRNASTITPQVFALFNSGGSYDRALAMANRLLAETDSPPRAIRRAFLLAYGRQPSGPELGECLEHWKRMELRHEHIDFRPIEKPSHVVREAVEEMSGERFSFTEELEVYADYIPDLKPWDTDAETRGLAEVCLVLMNSNEFVYVP